MPRYGRHRHSCTGRYSPRTYLTSGRHVSVRGCSAGATQPVHPSFLPAPMHVGNLPGNLNLLNWKPWPQLHASPVNSPHDNHNHRPSDCPQVCGNFSTGRVTGLNLPTTALPGVTVSRPHTIPVKACRCLAWTVSQPGESGLLALESWKVRPFQPCGAGVPPAACKSEGQANKPVPPPTRKE